MARAVKQVRANPQRDVDVMLDKFNKGVITLVDPSLQPKDSATDATNLMQEQDGRWRPRWGSAYYGVDAGATIYGAGVFVTSANVSELWCVAGTTFYRSQDDGATWDSCSGASFTAGHRVNGTQLGGYLYVYNGNDSLVRYDGTTTLQVYNSLSAPTSPSLAKTGLTTGSFTPYYIISAINEVGETQGTAEFTISGGVDKPRDQWDTSNYVTASWSASSNAKRYNIYYSDEAGRETYLDSVTADSTSYKDYGTVEPNPYVQAPLDNTTTGPSFADAVLSGNRIWTTADPDHTQRVWWTGTGQYIGAFSPFYGGGWVELEKGGRERPQKVVHYRDGRGSSYATVFTSDPEGNGSIWQIDLQDTTVGDTSFTVPVPVKIVGSIGTSAPLSVVSVKDDIIFFNRKGNFTIGSKPQLLNLLSTTEISVNIRPFIQALKGSAISNVCAYYYDGKVFQSVPYGSDTNNRIMVFDRERRNWNPFAFDFGVERFFEYSDASGILRFLAVPVNGTRLIRIAKGIRGDLGQPFTSNYLSPVIHLTKDRVGYGKIKKMWVELGYPRGDIHVELLGTPKKGAFSAQTTATIGNASSGVGWSSFDWSSNEWTYSPAPSNSAVSVLKRFKKVNKLLNNIQLRVFSSAADSDWVLQTIQVKGFEVPTNPPSSQKL